MGNYTQSYTNKMISTRQLLKEELLLNDRRNNLSLESLALIENPIYIKHILGIDVPLNESISFEIRRLIIEEEEKVSKFGETLRNYIGGKIAGTKEKITQVVTDVSTLKDAAVLIWDLWINPEFMIPAMKSIKGVLSGIFNSIKTAWGNITSFIGASSTNFKTGFDNIITKIENIVNKLSSGDGLFTFISIMGFAALLKWLYDNTIIKLVNFGNELVGLKDILSNLTDAVANFLAGFKDFELSALATFDIKPILEWFNTIGNNAIDIVKWFKQKTVQKILGNVVIGLQIISVLAFVLTPVIKSINWAKKLQKK